MPHRTRANDIAARALRVLFLVLHQPPHAPLSRRQLAEDCGCSTKTISNTVELLRSQMEIPLEPAPNHASGYVLTDPAWRLPIAHLDVGDALALALARDLVIGEGMPYQRQMRAALDKLTAGLPPPLKNLARSAATGLNPPHLPRSYADAPVAPLIAARVAQRTVEIDYESRRSQTRAWRRFDPYAVEPRDGVYWELHGWCHNNQAILTLALDRAHAVRDTGDSFVWRTEAWERFRCEQGVGGLRGGEAVAVDVRFSPQVAPYALALRWPEGLLLTSQPGGGARLHGDVRGMDGLVTELLRWRSEVRVVGGQVLLARITEEIRQMAALYAAEPPDPPHY